MCINQRQSDHQELELDGVLPNVNLVGLGSPIGPVLGYVIGGSGNCECSHAA